jgi:hypothetical protein
MKFNSLLKVEDGQSNRYINNRHDMSEVSQGKTTRGNFKAKQQDGLRKP